MSINSKNSFTLIELLVVISIMGILASAALISFRGPEAMAELSRVKEFSYAIRATMGADLAAEWRLNDQKNPTQDGSGYEYNGMLLPLGSEPEYVEGIFDKALEFDGSNYVEIEDSLGISAKTTFTYTVWIKPVDTGNRMAIIGGRYGDRDSLVVEPDGKIKLQLDKSYLISNGTINFNEWNYIIAAYDYNSIDEEETTVSLYINGSIDKTAVPSWHANKFDNWGDSTRWIGWEQRSDYYYTGLIDDVQVYKRVLTLSDVQRLYAQGTAEHELVLK